MKIKINSVGSRFATAEVVAGPTGTDLGFYLYQRLTRLERYSLLSHFLIYNDQYILHQIRVIDLQKLR